jgi:tape measure domain-containing protein
MADQRTLRVVIVGNASQAEAALRGLGDEAEDLERQTGRFSGALAGMGGRLAAFGATVAAGIGIGAGAVGVMAFKAAADAESMQVAFETLTGSAANAKKHMQDLTDFAARTPFELKGLQQASVKLQGVGVSAKDVIPHLTAWGNAASAMGVRGASFDNVLTALSQAIGNGRFSLEDFNQMADNGLSVWKSLEEATGKSSAELREMASAGQLTTDKILPLLEGVFNSKWGDAMDKQSKTANGQLAAMSDAWDALLIKLGTPLLPVGKKAIAGLSGIISDLGSNVSPLGDTFRGIGRGLREGFAAAGSVLAPFKAEFAKIGPDVQRGISAVGATFSQLGSVVRGSVLPLFRSVASAVAPVLGTIAGVVYGTVIPALMGLVQTVLPHFRTFVNFLRTQIVPVLSGMFQQAQPVIQQFGNVIRTVLQGIGVAVNVLAPILQILWKFLGPVVITTLKGLWSGILGVISGALSVIQGVVNVFIGIFTGNWSRAWNGVKQIFSGIWKFIVGAFKVWIYGSIVGILRGGVAKILSLWRSGWNAVKGAFSGVVNFIKGGVSGWVSGIKSVISGGVNFIKQVWSLGWNGIKTTISTNAKGVLQIAKEIPGKIKGFFTSLPGMLKEIGRNIIQGLVNGIRGSLGAVMSAAKGIVDQIPGPIKKALGIHSPSRVMAQIGKWITEGLVKGMLAGSKKVASTSKKLHALVTKAFKAGKISKGKAKGLHEYISAQNKKLLGLSKEREKISKGLSSANKKLAGLKAAKAEMASQVSSKARDYGSFMGALDTSEYGDNSASAILARLKGKLKGITDFRKNLQTLAKRGIGRGIINQIAQAGPEEGGQMAQALLNAGGGQIKELNSTYNAINSESGKLGNFVAGDYYNAGIFAMTGLVKGLKAKESALTKQIEKLAKSMVKTLKKKLGIKSPSRVFMGLGGFTAAGFTNGIRNGQGDVQKAVDEMAATRPTGRMANRSIARAMALQGASGGQAAPVVHVTVQGNVTAEKALAKSIATTIRDEIVRSGKRNGGRTGL